MQIENRKSASCKSSALISPPLQTTNGHFVNEKKETVESLKCKDEKTGVYVWRDGKGNEVKSLAVVGGESGCCCCCCCFIVMFILTITNFRKRDHRWRQPWHDCGHCHQRAVHNWRRCGAGRFHGNIINYLN